MNKLEKLYDIIQSSKEIGLELGPDVLKQVDEKEEQIIKDEILPALCKDIDSQDKHAGIECHLRYPAPAAN